METTHTIGTTILEQLFDGRTVSSFLISRKPGNHQEAVLNFQLEDGSEYHYALHSFKVNGVRQNIDIKHLETK